MQHSKLGPGWDRRRRTDGFLDETGIKIYEMNRATHTARRVHITKLYTVLVKSGSADVASELGLGIALRLGLWLGIGLHNQCLVMHFLVETTTRKPS